MIMDMWRTTSTVEILAKASILAASAGYDVLAPSDMMDGQVGIIRSHLEKTVLLKPALCPTLLNLLFLLRPLSRRNWSIKPQAH